MGAISTIFRLRCGCHAHLAWLPPCPLTSGFVTACAIQYQAIVILMLFSWMQLSVVILRFNPIASKYFIVDHFLLQAYYIDAMFCCKLRLLLFHSCNQGWTGSLCSTCRTRVGCVNGTCTVPGTCDCNDGWGGTNCDKGIN